MKKKICEGNRHSKWCAKLVVIAEKLGIPCYVENPDGSWLWRQREWKRYSLSSGYGCLRLDCCRFGMAWRKRTRFITTCEVLKGHSLLCRHDHTRKFTYRGREYEHQLLRGVAPWGQDWTKFAEAYPLGVADLLAAGFVYQVSETDRTRKLDVELFAEAATKRKQVMQDEKERREKRKAGGMSRPARP